MFDRLRRLNYSELSLQGRKPYIRSEKIRRLAIKKQNTKIDCLVSYVSIDEAGYTTISSVTVYIYFLTRYSTSEIITTPQIHYANTYSQKNGAFLKVIKVISYSTAD